MTESELLILLGESLFWEISVIANFALEHLLNTQQSRQTWEVYGLGIFTWKRILGCKLSESTPLTTFTHRTESVGGGTVEHDSSDVLFMFFIFFTTFMEQHSREKMCFRIKMKI